MSTTKKHDKPAYDFVQRHYRAPASTDPVQRWLTHPEVARAICGTLARFGIRRHDTEDGLQEVYLKALEAFRSGTKVPESLESMKIYCAAIARNHAFDERRKAAVRARDLAEPIELEEHVSIEHRAEKRDTVDAGRQLELLAALFREGKMPKNGVEILEALAGGCSQEEIAEELGVTLDVVKGRLRMMRDRFCARVEDPVHRPGAKVLSLDLVAALPAAFEKLKRAA
jgi:RNA polymerase sigma factor (sigma-70 family)